MPNIVKIQHQCFFFFFFLQSMYRSAMWAAAVSVICERPCLSHLSQDYGFMQPNQSNCSVLEGYSGKNRSPKLMLRSTHCVVHLWKIQKKTFGYSFGSKCCQDCHRFYIYNEILSSKAFILVSCNAQVMKHNECAFFLTTA